MSNKDCRKLISYVKKFYDGSINGISIGKGLWGNTIFLHKCRGLFRDEERDIEKDIEKKFPEYRVEVCLIPVTIGECNKIWYQEV